jgi:hypothetical protein
MGTVTPEFAALRYLDQWFLKEARLSSRIRSKSEDVQRVALAGAVQFFRVARNLPQKYDVHLGHARYEPLRIAVANLPPECMDAPEDAVAQFAGALSREYGGKGVQSLSSKLLWLLYKDPIVIYDSKARNALGGRESRYSSFLVLWEDRWAVTEPQIAQACGELPQVVKYAQCSGSIGVEQVAEVSQSRWFQRRVLDVMLWYAG